jgi:hypothetical protein
MAPDRAVQKAMRAFILGVVVAQLIHTRQMKRKACCNYGGIDCVRVPVHGRNLKARKAHPRHKESVVSIARCLTAVRQQIVASKMTERYCMTS